MLMLKLTLGWLFTLAFAAGPYVALLVYAAPFHPVYHGLYWVVMGMYILWGLVSEVNISQDDLQQAAFPNPFSYEDEWARNKIMFSLILVPAIVMAWTIKVTWYVVRGAGG